MANQKALRAQYAQQPQTALRQFRVHTSSSPGASTPSARVAAEGFEAAGVTTVAHPFVGGPGGAPCPGDLLLMALASCMEISVRSVAANLGIELVDVQVEAGGELDARGPMLLARDVPAGFRKMFCRARVTTAGAVAPDAAERLVRSTERSCSIMATLRAGNEIDARIDVAAGDRR